MSDIQEYSSKSTAIRGFLRFTGNLGNPDLHVKKFESGKWGFEKGAAVTAIAEENIEIAELDAAFDTMHSTTDAALDAFIAKRDAELSALAAEDVAKQIAHTAQVEEAQKAYEAKITGYEADRAAKIARVEEEELPSLLEVMTETALKAAYEAPKGKRAQSPMGKGAVAWGWAFCGAHQGLSRKETTQALEAAGITHNTARTLYQHWFAAGKPMSKPV